VYILEQILKWQTRTLQLGDESTEIISAIILFYTEWRNSKSRNWEYSEAQ